MVFKSSMKYPGSTGLGELVGFVLFSLRVSFVVVCFVFSQTFLKVKILDKLKRYY